MNQPEGPPPAPSGQTVLVVDDEPMVREVLTTYLERDGFEVTQAADGDEARDALGGATPDLVVLDVMLPGASGLDLLGEIRRQGDIPVILLTARADEADRVTGLELGADDYVVKPFSPREVAARVRSVLRRTASVPSGPGPLRFGGVEVDVAARLVSVGGAGVELTPKEFDLLVFLASHPHQVFSRAQLLERVWSSSPEWQDPATVTVHIRRLRHKIERDPAAPDHLITVFGVGYRFEP
jgi:two-component system, OmpR family, phosphate regulon response regulator PhoB